MTGSEWIFCGLCIALVCLQLILVLLFLLFVASRARLAVLTREEETTMDSEEKPVTTAVNITDNPAFTFEYICSGN